MGSEYRVRLMLSKSGMGAMHHKRRKSAKFVFLKGMEGASGGQVKGSDMALECVGRALSFVDDELEG
jgi:hypothetical protein